MLLSIKTAVAIWTFVNDPAVQAAASAALVLGGTMFAYLIKTQPTVREYAQELADLTRDAKAWVEQAEALDLPGVDKAAEVMRRFEAWLKLRGIEARGAAVLRKHAPAIIEAAVRTVQPKRPAREPRTGPRDAWIRWEK